MTPLKAVPQLPEAAPRPELRTVELEVGEAFPGWVFTVRVDFPARVLLDLYSGEVDRVLPALEVLITEHNFPDMDGRVASSLLDVDPLAGVLAALSAYQRHRSTVPNP